VSTSQLLLKQSTGHSGTKMTEVEMTDYGQMVIHKQQVTESLPSSCVLLNIGSV